ncbi:MAG: tetratricopeptide repeat protein [Syntrophobacteraceae bacterium]|nr:tetratricopeptide repeat protein [Syntrophobacteraceae bacterium]
MSASVPSLSVCMIVKNEAHHLGEALTSFSGFADEIVVVDTGSEDNTRTIATQYTSHVYDFPWCEDFSAARNFSLEKARGRYILWLDADDRLDSVMQERVRNLKDHFSTGRAFYFILQNVDESGPSWSCHQLRCVPNRPDVRFRGRVHEQLHPSVERAGIEEVRTDIVIHHYGYTERGHFLQKMRRNLAILEKERMDGRDDEHVHYYLAVSQETLGLYSQAVASMERALVHLERRIHDRSPENGSPNLQSVMEGYLFLAGNYARLGDPGLAHRNLLRANAMADEDPEVHYRLGCMFQRLGRHPQAIGCFRKALSTERQRVRFHPSEPLPPPSTIRMHVALSLLCMGKETEGLDVLGRVNAMGVPWHEMFEWLGLKALHNGEWRLSLRSYQAIRQEGELSSDGLCNLGLIHDKLGDFAKAMECYAAALEKTPGHFAALANRAHLHFRKGDWDKAWEGFNTLVQGCHRDLDFLLPMALISLKKKRRNEFERVERLIRRQTSPPPSVGTSEDLFRWLSEGLEAEKKGKLANWAGEAAGELLKNP